MAQRTYEQIGNSLATGLAEAPRSPRARLDVIGAMIEFFEKAREAHLKCGEVESMAALDTLIASFKECVRLARREF